MPGSHGHNEITRNELPHGGIGLTPGVTDKSTNTIYDLAKIFDKNHKAGANNVTTTNDGKKAAFSGSTFNTNSTGTANANELFNNGKGKTGDNYDD